MVSFCVDDAFLNNIIVSLSGRGETDRGRDSLKHLSATRM
jgi:hypothetical protein